MDEHFFLFFITLLGLCFGSFFNVLIYRLPRGGSIFSPSRSFCPHCKVQIPFYDNIPVLGFLLLRGRCRECQEKISYRYLIVEIISGFLFFLIAWKYGISLKTMVYIILVGFLIPISFIDWDTKLILNKLTYPCFLLGIVLVSVFQIEKWYLMLIGGLGSGVVLFLLGVLGNFIFKKETMGFGDVKLIVIIGTYIGFPAVFIALYIGVLIAGIYILIALLLKKLKLKETIPFGPFLALGTIVYLLYGEQLINWYLSIVI